MQWKGRKWQRQTNKLKWPTEVVVGDFLPLLFVILSPNGFLSGKTPQKVNSILSLLEKLSSRKFRCPEMDVSGTRDIIFLQFWDFPDNSTTCSADWTFCNTAFTIINVIKFVTLCGALCCIPVVTVNLVCWLYKLHYTNLRSSVSSENVHCVLTPFNYCISHKYAHVTCARFLFHIRTDVLHNQKLRIGSKGRKWLLLQLRVFY